MADLPSLALKTAAGGALVLSITWLAESMGPGAAGVLMALPTMTSINLLAIGLAQGADFAAESAAWNPLGLSADVAFVLAFVLSGRLARGRPRSAGLAASLSGGLAALALSAWALFALAPSGLLARLGVLAGCILVLALATRGLPDAAAPEGPRGALLPRALLAGLVVAAVAAAAERLGPAWAGLLSAFPATILPVLALLHRAHGPEVTDAVVKHSWKGFCATGAYAALVATLYPTAGVAWGTALALGGAAIVALGLDWAERIASLYKS